MLISGGPRSLALLFCLATRTQGRAKKVWACYPNLRRPASLAKQFLLWLYFSVQGSLHQYHDQARGAGGEGEEDTHNDALGCEESASALRSFVGVGGTKMLWIASRGGARRLLASLGSRASRVPGEAPGATKGTALLVENCLARPAVLPLASVVGAEPRADASAARRLLSASASAVAEPSPGDGAEGGGPGADGRAFGLIPPPDPSTRKREGFPREHRRCGAVAMKCGMTREWDANGVGVPLTVLWLDENRVVQVKTEEKEGFFAVQVGAGSRRRKRLNNALAGHFDRHLGGGGSVVSRKVTEFKVTESCLLEGGTRITADHFVPGQLVDVRGTTRGKGFAGGMKRHGMKGGPASHGTTKAHRTIGSTGQCQDPGKVFKGKKMPGRMGGKTRTQQRLLVYKVDPLHNLVYVKGQVPGGKGSYVSIVDTKIGFQDVALPYPTAKKEEGEEVKVAIAPASTKNDPFKRYWAQ